MCYPGDEWETIMSAETGIYKVIFLNQGKVYEIFARKLLQSNLFGFIEIEKLIFGERSRLIVDASQENLKSEFADVKRVFIPLHSVIRIDEVEKEGPGRIRESEQETGNLKMFPVPVPNSGPTRMT